MPLDLVGKLHRAVYVDGCAPSFYEDLVRLLVTKCGEIEAWDVTNRLIVVFKNINSVSTALSFNGTAFGDLGGSLKLWVATQPPPAGVEQQMTIAANPSGSSELKDGKAAEEVRAAYESRQRRLAAIRSELAPEIEQAESVESVEMKQRELCIRQLKALCILTSHAVAEMEKALEESKSHLQVQKRLLDNLRAKKQNSSSTSRIVSGGSSGDGGGGGDGSDKTGSGNFSDPVTRRVEELVANAEDIGKWRKRRRE
ncbi:hypothetical protein ERJ75_000244700 [Trypanosoma vivax]|uniref:Uncharacterized protein n=1 Tax=Trypanosoma vivax (strain Y486) TaxID=1055687 RepID=G0U3W0_TRYVY|nr:hypothetical protein TRVL_05396 [Trypanosoma vivax]KAH8618635.1 hypothetical protein ERJ75_000244700 [Trypanosoma vivax]CCC50200.1 conserved hypothetical protein [Trypanosoma vivax Y486]